nr:cyochrome c1 ABC transporter channel subunit [Cavernulicola chilensis]
MKLILCILKREIDISDSDKAMLFRNIIFFTILLWLSKICISETQKLLNIVALNVVIITLFTFDSFLYKEKEAGLFNLYQIAKVPIVIILYCKTLSYWGKFILPVVFLGNLIFWLSLDIEVNHFLNSLLIILIMTYNFAIINLIINVLIITVERKGPITSIIAFPLYLPTIIFGVIALDRLSSDFQTNFEGTLIISYTLFITFTSPIISASILKKIN